MILFYNEITKKKQRKFSIAKVIWTKIILKHLK